MVPLVLPGARLGRLVALRLPLPPALLDRMLPALLHRVALLHRNLRHRFEMNIPSKGASINDVRNNFGFFDTLPPLSANSRNPSY